MRRLSRLSRLTGVLTVIGVLTASVAATSPAHAYGSLDVFFAEFNPSTCTVLEGTLQIGDDGRCRVDYVVDGQALHSWFQPDVNSRAVAVRLWNGSQLVGFVEFHPYDEILYVVDTENDGDTIYVEFLVEDPGNPAFWKVLGVYHPPGTSSVIDFLELDLSIVDGRDVFLTIWDDAGRTDLIGGFSGVA